MKKKNESGADNSASADENQTSNLSAQFVRLARDAMEGFETVFEGEMSDDLRACIYLLRRDVTELIEVGKALASGAPDEVVAAAQGGAR
jgi:hypothetical protein